MLFGLAKELGDEELVRRFLQGDKHAFSQLVRRYQDRVFGLCYRWLGDADTAEEVAQDVFLALYKALDRFRGESSFSTYLFRITVNHCKNQRNYRERRAWNLHEPLEGKREQGRTREIPSTEESDGQAIQEEASVLVQKALDALGEEHRQVLILRDIEDLEYEEIASLLAIPKGTVKSRIHRARAELARILRNHLGKEDVKV